MHGNTVSAPPHNLDSPPGPSVIVDGVHRTPKTLHEIAGHVGGPHDDVQLVKNAAIIGHTLDQAGRTQHTRKDVVQIVADPQG